ncbi:MAG: hypothetical protein ACTSRG_10820 [Candidatus Helarchaeota archaeon]
MLQDFWIVEKKSGRCLFNKSYGDTTTDPDLLTSFLSALYRFSEEVSTRHKGIESIEMGGLKWAYNDKDNLLFIVTAEKDDNTSDMRSQVNIMRINFLEQFPECAEENFSETFDGNITRFDKFATIVDELIHSWRELEKVTNAAEMMDILEVYQQVFDRLSKIIPTIKNKGRKKINDKMLHLKEVLPKSFENISYSETGWDFLTINVFHQDINEEELRIGLRAMLRYYFDILLDIFKEKMPEIIRSLLFPYLRSDWNRISKLKLDEIFIDLFLI